MGIKSMMILLNLPPLYGKSCGSQDELCGRHCGIKI